MLLNSSPVATHSTPRSIVVIGGREVEFLNWTVENTGYEQADTFEIDFPFEVTAQKEDSILTSNSSISSLLFTEKDIMVEVYRGVPKDPNNYTIKDLTRTIMGYVDSVELEFDENGEVIKLDGRDLSALMIDNQIASKYQNNTSSQIASILAKKHGLTPNVTNTTTLAGTYYNKDSSVISDTSSEWDLLMYLAQQEGFVVRVSGTTLYFGPIEKVTSISLPPIEMTWGDNISSLTIDRQPHGARDIEVKVFSYDRKTKKQVVGTATAKSINTKKLTSPLNRDVYKEYYQISGLTKAQADAKAKSILQQLSLDQLVGTLKTNGEMDFTVDRRISLQGVGAILSQTYYISRVTEYFDLTSSDGFYVEIAFVNELLLPGGLNGV